MVRRTTVLRGIWTSQESHDLTWQSKPHSHPRRRNRGFRCDALMLTMAFRRKRASLRKGCDETSDAFPKQIERPSVSKKCEVADSHGV